MLWNVLESFLAAEAIEGAPLSSKRVDDVHGSDGLAAGVLSVGHSVADHVLEEDLEDGAGLLINESGYALHAASACKATDGRLGNALDVVPQNLAMTLCASLAQTLAAESFTEAFAPDLTASHEVEHVVEGVQNIQNGVQNGKMRRERKN